MEKSRDIKKSVAIIMGATFISRLMGWVKLGSMSSIFGRSVETDAFVAAFLIPDLLYMLVSGGAMTAAFIPIFTDYITAGKEKEGWRFASSVWNQTFIVILVFVILGEIFARRLLVFVPEFRKEPEALLYGIEFIRILFPMVVFTAGAAFCNGILHSKNHFSSPAVSWLLYNLSFIVSVYVFRNTLGLKGVCIGSLVGAISMVAVQLPAILKRGGRYTPTFDIKSQEIRKYWKLFLPIMLGMSLTQINIMMMPTIIGSLVGEGAITSLNFANRLMFIPIGLFGSAISMAVFPAMSQMTSAGDMDATDLLLVRSIRATLFFSLPCAVLMFVVGLPAIRLALGYGKFDYNDCAATAIALYGFAVGLAGHTVVQVIIRGFYSRKDSVTPVATGVCCLLITIPLSLVLIKTPLRHGGVALAVSISALFNTIILMILAKRKLNLRMNLLAPMIMKMVPATLVMFAVGAAANKMFHLGPNNFSHSTALAAFVVVSGASCLAFAAMCKILKIEEFDAVLSFALRKFMKKRASA